MSFERKELYSQMCDRERYYLQENNWLNLSYSSDFESKRGRENILKIIKIIASIR